jgi:hypothetical protein
MRHAAMARGTPKKTAQKRAMLVAFFSTACGAIRVESSLDAVESMFIDDRLVFALMNLVLVPNLAGVGYIRQHLVQPPFGDRQPAA